MIKNIPEPMYEIDGGSYSPSSDYTLSKKWVERNVKEILIENYGADYIPEATLERIVMNIMKDKEVYGIKYKCESDYIKAIDNVLKN